jgi:hypothetical protein
MQTITINNTDTENIHIDTYGMLTGDSHEESTIEYESEQTGRELTYDDFDWTYDHAGIVKDLAHESIDILLQAIAHTDYAKIITGITYVSSTSPGYYNYKTDSYMMNIQYDIVQLDKYVTENYAAIYEICKKYHAYECDITEDDRLYAAIVHILDNCIDSESYNYAMWETEYQAYSENTTYTINEPEPTTTT